MIVCAGLSPAWQQIYQFDGLRLGEVNRARHAAVETSGKILNALLAVHRLGAAGRGVTVMGGPLGRVIAEKLANEGVDLRVIPSATPTRTCVTVIDQTTGAITELVENAGPISSAELAEFQSAVREEASGASHLVLMGSLPEGASPGTFREILEGQSVSVVADIRGPELLEILSLKPKVVKPNREELGYTFGDSIQSDEDLRRAMRRLEELGAQWVVVSAGPREVWARGDGAFHRFVPPRIEQVNPIGSGDAFASSIAVALSRGETEIEAIRFGMAAAVENASCLMPIDITPEGVAARREEIEYAHWA